MFVSEGIEVFTEHQLVVFTNSKYKWK